MPALIDGLQSNSAGFRAAVAQTLWLIGADARPAVPALRQALKDPDPRVRLYAAQSLWAVNRRAEEVLDVLIALLHTEGDAGLRRAACYAIGSMGADARKAVPSLKQALKDDADLDVRSVRGPGAVDPGRQGGTHPAGAARGPGVEGSGPAKNGGRGGGALGLTAHSTIPLLQELLRSGDADLRAAAASALGSMGPEAAPVVPDLIRLAGEQEPMVREQAVYALQMIGPRSAAALPLLKELLKDPSLMMRGRAALALAAVARGTAGHRSPGRRASGQYRPHGPPLRGPGPVVDREKPAAGPAGALRFGYGRPGEPFAALACPGDA